MTTDTTRRPSPHRTLRLPVLLVLLAMPTGTAFAQTGEGLELSPGFESDPITRTGVAGGPVGAETLGTGPMGACVGWVPSQPQLEMTLTAPFDYLDLAVTSTGDTTLVIEGPVGYWCNDDSSGLNPAMFGHWAEGHYRVWVGTYSPGESLPYTLTITAQRETEPFAGGPPPGGPGTPGGPPTGPPGGPPTGVVTPPGPGAAGPGSLDLAGTTSNFGPASLAPGFMPDPQVLAGTSGGGVQASSLGNTAFGPCRGWIARTPDHLLTLNAPLPFLRIDATSAGDTTLVVYGPGGFLCNDDSIGLNPRVAGSFPAGTYRIWVGSYEAGQLYPYQLSFSQHP